MSAPAAEPYPDAPWWAGLYPSDPDRFPDLSIDEENDRADREAHR